MDFDIKSLKVFVSPQELNHSILQKRLARVSARKPGFRIAFIHPVISFFWLFCIFASLSTAVLSLSLVGHMATEVIYKLLPLSLGGTVVIPLVSSMFSLWQRRKRYLTELALCRREPITEVEITEYFEGYKSSFLLQYQEYINTLNSKFNFLPEEFVETQTLFSSDVVRRREPVADIIERLTQVKSNYLSRLEFLERDFIKQLKQEQKELFMESAAEFDLALEHLSREIDMANTYLKAARKLDLGKT
ncbi:MAG: hypothetical protein F6K14_04515 [Symploca sp. SIO2C1]|nr:hypothetical protein [Symploca sp. SIO2C1]